MDNKEFLVMQEQLRAATEDPAFKKLREHRIILLTHLQQPAHKLVVEYFSVKKLELQRQLDYTWINSIGRDVSDIIRGKIHMVDEFVNMETVFDRFDKLQKLIEEQKKDLK